MNGVVPNGEGCWLIKRQNTSMNQTTPFFKEVLLCICWRIPVIACTWYMEIMGPKSLN